jgi:TP901 family phage tail tape measure protein
MSTEKLRLEVLLAAIDKVTGPLKAITKGSGDAARALRAAKDQLKDIEGQQKAIAAFKDADKAAAITANAFKGVQEQVKHLQREMAKTPEPTRAMVKALKDAQAESDALKARHASLMDKQQRLFAQMKAGGIDTRNLATHSRDLATRQIEAARSVDKLKQSLEAQNKTLARMHAARANYDKSMAAAGKLRSAGMVGAGAGAAIGLPAIIAAKDYATFEDAMLGVARQVEGARDANGKLTQTYHDMGAAIKQMAERIPMTTVEIAKIVEAGARMGIQGKENLLIYAQTTAVMAQAFDLPVDRVGESIGKISQLYKIPIKDIKALGDTINWLDDNALAKGGDIIDVMQRVAGAATMVKMSFRDAAALGSTFLSLGTGPEIAASATNAMIRELSIATMQTKRFRGGLEMLKLDAKGLQLGMTQDATGTILKVLAAIKALPQEKQLEAATRLFGKEFGDDAAKLAENLDEYRRQLTLVNEERARGSMQREADARRDTINARLTMAKSAFFNLSSDLGEHLKPALVATMERMLAIAQAVRGWAKENPALASGIMTTVKWVAGLVTGAGALLILLGAIAIPLAAVQFAMASLGITAAIAAAGIWAVLKPVLLVVGAFAAGWAAGKLFNGWIDAALSKMLGYQTTLGGSLFDLVELVTSLPAKFMDAGGRMIDGLIAGIRQRWDALKSTVTDVAASTVGWLKDKLGIRSPSRVFAEIGGYTMEGLQQGILRGQDGPLAALARAARGIVAAGAGVLVAGGAMAGSIDTRPPIGGGMGGALAPMHVEIHIHAAPGQSPEDIGREVARQLELVEHRRAAGRRSRLVDAE